MASGFPRRPQAPSTPDPCAVAPLDTQQPEGASRGHPLQPPLKAGLQQYQFWSTVALSSQVLDNCKTGTRTPSKSETCSTGAYTCNLD